MCECTDNKNVRPDSAAAAYARKLANVSTMLGWIESELEVHARRQRAKPASWGFVGDLTEMEKLVKAALGHISGMESSRIDDALAEKEEDQLD
jgi:hypothetical protein